MKRQFNVYLDATLIARLKHRAIDESISLSGLVSRVFERELRQKENVVPTQPPVTLQPIVHVGNMAESLRFYGALGATVMLQSRDGDFALIRIGATEVALLAHPPNPEQSEDYVELAFASERPLREVEAHLRSQGVTIVRGAADEAFGEQLQIESPDGLLIKVNRLEHESFA